jgi:hypothetical protein
MFGEMLNNAPPEETGSSENDDLAGHEVDSSQSASLAG